ncbi:hypothetical protein ACFWFZ_02745 [Streptomyces sp. NPDC060232]|uniref:hypothetical protein n=1 Tax=Streptomyces sp. NPDC060232 TaxID=3347079 RepID=UPI0036541980
MTADAHEITFRQRASRKQTQGISLLLVAGCIWIALAYQLFAPFSIQRDSNGSIECASRVFYDDGADDGRRSRLKTYAEAEGTRCAVARDFADMLGLLVLSLPFAAIGIFQCTSGALTLALRHHEDELALKAERPAEPATPAEPAGPAGATP